jgi:LysR family glycine cleavage system transcriptional activator
LLRLPSFSNLIAFDAIARHGTLTRAAEELNVSQPAISRRLAALEADLGHLLFDRRTKPLALTKSGAELFDVLRSGLSRLETVICRLRSSNDSESVTISAGSGLAAYWLIPRLPEMQSAFPTLRLKIVSQSHQQEDDGTGDLQIRFGQGGWAGIEATKMFGEEVFPVCSPLHLGSRKMPFSLDQLKVADLLDMKVENQPWYDWNSWFEAAGTVVHRAPRILYFDSYPLVVGAALAGQGICLSWAGLLDGLLASGALVRLSPLSMPSPRGYFVTHEIGLPPNAHARAIARWLLDSAMQAVASQYLTPARNNLHAL